MDFKSPSDHSAANLVIDSLDEFAAGVFACATTSDYAVAALQPADPR